MSTPKKLESRFSHWKYKKHKNVLFLLLSIAFGLMIFRQPVVGQQLRSLGSLSYLGVFVAGMFFTSTFTATISVLILTDLAKKLPLLTIVPVAGMGAVLGDFLIFFIVKKNVVKEIRPIYDQVIGNHFRKILHTKYFLWTLPVLGAILIASPLPDELGISLLGLAKTKTSRLFLISLLSHAMGMFLLVSALRLI